MAQTALCHLPPTARPLRLRLFDWLPLRRLGVPRIDPDDLPDHLKRDLGLADGRGPRPRDPQRY